MTNTETFPAGALAYIDAYQAEASRLRRLTVVELRQEYRKVLDEKRLISISGGPVLKHELIDWISKERHPRWKEAIEQRGAEVAAQQYGATVQSLAISLGTMQDEFLAEVLRAAHPAAIARLRRMLADLSELKEI